MKKLLISALLLLLTGITAFAQADLQPVATVRLTRSEPITVRQLRQELDLLVWQNFRAQFGRNPTAAEVSREVQNIGLADRRMVLDMMINQRLVLQAAERDRIIFTDNELNQNINMLRAQMAQDLGRQPTEEEFATAVRNETGQDLPAFRESFRRQSIFNRYLMTAKADLFNNIQQPSDAEIVNFYNLSRADFIRPETVRYTMIQVPYGPDAASRARAREMADRLNREIGNNSTRFDEAVLRGQAPNSGYMAGDAGYLPRNHMAQQMAGVEFMNTAFTLRQGEVSGLIEGIPGFQIIKVTETLPQAALGLDDIMDPGSRTTVRQFIAQSMLQQRQQETLMRATQELFAELREGNPFQIMEQNLNF
ncbi:MAG: peptidyl-prolyl cis-trans isomerase [Treponema sp.]|nr:peptidyl-prolyl cis-trans isomerase [Treponema sp.]